MAQHGGSSWLETRGSPVQGMDLPDPAEMTSSDLFTPAATPGRPFQWQDLLAALPGLLSGAQGGGGAFLQGFAQGQAMVDEQRSRQAVMAQQQTEREALRVERRTEQEATRAHEARREAVEAETRAQSARENATAFLQREAAALTEILDPEERQARLQFGAQLFQETFPDRGDPSAYLAQLRTSGRHLRERADDALTKAAKAYPEMVGTPEWGELWLSDFWGPGKHAKIKEVEVYRQGRVLQPSGIAVPPSPPRTGSVEEQQLTDLIITENDTRRQRGQAPLSRSEIAKLRLRVRKELGEAGRPSITIQTTRPLTRKERFDAIRSLQNDWRTVYKPHQELLRQFSLMQQGLRAAKRGDLNAGSQAILVTFQKILDPTSVVRESEYARSGEGLALLSQMEGAIDRLRRGGAGVPLAELEAFVRTGQDFVTNFQAFIRQEHDRITALAESAGLDPNLIFTAQERQAPEQDDTLTRGTTRTGRRFTLRPG